LKPLDGAHDAMLNVRSEAPAAATRLTFHQFIFLPPVGRSMGSAVLMWGVVREDWIPIKTVCFVGFTASVSSMWRGAKFPAAVRIAGVPDSKLHGRRAGVRK
jgi:hypothetical protein